MNLSKKYDSAASPIVFSPLFQEKVMQAGETLSLC